MHDKTLGNVLMANVADYLDEPLSKKTLTHLEDEVNHKYFEFCNTTLGYDRVITKYITVRGFFVDESFGRVNITPNIQIRTGIRRHTPNKPIPNMDLMARYINRVYPKLLGMTGDELAKVYSKSWFYWVMR